MRQTQLFTVLVALLLAEIGSASPASALGHNYDSSFEVDYQNIAEASRDLDNYDVNVCPSGFEYIRETSGCFKLILQPLSWHRAGEVCRKLNSDAHLVTVRSAIKQHAISSYLRKQFKQGGSHVCLNTPWGSGGKQVWTSGQTQNPNQCGTPYVWKTFEAVKIPFSYYNWMAGEPNCYKNAEHCALISEGHAYTWVDAKCNLPGCSLCEI